MSKRSSEARQAELAALIEGRSDEEIVRGVEARGITTVLDTVFAGMVDAFLPEKAGSECAVVQYDVTASGKTYPYHFTVADGRCTLGKGPGPAPRVTVTLGLPHFLRLVGGSLNATLAYMTGKLRVRGELLLAQRMTGWFHQR
jgi:hypothetical protein